MNITFIKADATCHTLGCGNENITLHIDVVKGNPYVICGPCGFEITDLVLVNNA